MMVDSSNKLVDAWLRWTKLVAEGVDARGLPTSARLKAENWNFFMISPTT
jgi:hypothetical protein